MNFEQHVNEKGEGLQCFCCKQRDVSEGTLVVVMEVELDFFEILQLFLAPKKRF